MKTLSVWIGWLLASWTVVAQETAAPKPARTGLVRGRVLDAAGAPVAGAAIGLMARATWTTAEVLKSPGTKTGADGRFALPVSEPEDGKPAPTCVLAAPGLASAELTLPGWSEPEVDCGDLQLAEGATLKGRVRGKDGKPVAGARVEAADLIFGGGTGRLAFVSAAASSAEGAFELPGALPLGARLTVTAPGHYTATLAPAGVGEPLVVELTTSGFVAGRVLNAQGKPALATLTARHETGLTTAAIPMAADGTFKFTLAHRGRFRLSAVERTNGARSSSALLEGPMAGVELRPKAAGPATSLAIRAVDAASGSAVPAFKAGIRWLRAGMQYSADSITPTTPSSSDGLAHLPGPTNESLTEGTARVTAAGFAPAALKELEAKEGEEVVVEAKLVKESVLEGKVVDEATGQPVAGATLSIQRAAEEPAAGANMAIRTVSSSGARAAIAATTGPEGSFRLGELGAGTYEITVQCRQRPDLKSERLKLAAQETRKDLVLKISKGLTLQGRLTGLKPGPRWAVRVEEEADDAGPRQLMAAMRGTSNEPGLTPVGADGSFSIPGLKPGNYALRLSIPGAPRSGPVMDILVDKFRLKQADLKRDFELAGDGPGILRGKLVVTGASLPRGRFVVYTVPQPKEAGANAVFTGLSLSTLVTRRALLAADGSYSLELGSGEYRLEVLDLLSNTVVHREQEPIKIQGAGATSKDLAVQLVPLRVAFTPESYIAASMSVAFEQDGRDPQVDQLVTVLGGVPGRGGSPLSLAESPREVTLFVPPGDVKLAVLGKASGLAERSGAMGGAMVAVAAGGPARPGEEPLGTAEVTVKAGEPAQVTIQVAPPPALEDAAGKK